MGQARVNLGSSGQPPLAVVMPVRNALPYLDAAVRSILDQSFGDFEFLIYDDASTDGSTERLREWALKDARIKLFQGTRQLGPALSSREIAAKATAPLVARMDADDLSLPDRLRRQVALLDARPEVGLVASLCDVIDADGRFQRAPEYWRLGRQSCYAPFPHGSITYRKTVYDRAGGYRAECEYWEDQDLVVRMAGLAPLLVIPESLYQNRLTLRSQQRGSYEALLGADAPQLGKYDPRAFIAAGSLLLWAGGKPDVLGRLMRRARLRPDLASLAAVVWAAWGAVNPASLRFVLMQLLKLHNRRAALASSAEPVLWQPVRRNPDQARPSSI